MHIEEIYASVKSKWPAVINIKDGILVSESSVLSKTLTTTWNQAEAKITNDWEDVGVWVFYGLLHKKVMEQFVTGQYDVEVNTISLEAFKEKYPDALDNNGDEEMAAIYKRMNA